VNQLGAVSKASGVNLPESDATSANLLTIRLPGPVALLARPAIALLLGSLLAPGSHAQIAASESPLLPPPGARVIQLTPRPGKYSEPSIALNPGDPRQLVAAFQVNATAAFSRDAGNTWAIAEGTAPPDYHRSGDVAVTYDNQGHAFLCYIAFDKLGTENYWAHNATRNGIFVRRSLDGGKTWEKDAATVIAHPSDTGIPFEDKPYIVADTTRSKYAGNLYVGWTEFTLTKSIMLFSRSSDHGQSWSPPIEISTKEGLPRDDNGAVEGFTGAVGADGTLYVVWCDISGIVLAVSKNGGRTFSRSRTIVKTGPSYFDPEHVYRGNGFPEIGGDPRSNRLFVAWSDYTNGDIDVFVASSTDRGKHWSAPVRVNNDLLHNGRDQFFQWLAVDPIDGSVNVIFCDRRTDPGNRAYYMVLARSTDSGKTFQNWVWSTKPSDPSDVFMGDYMGIAAGGSKVYGIWTRTALAEEWQPEEKLPKSQMPPGANDQAGAKEEEPANEKPEGAKTSASKLKGMLLIEIGLADFSAPISAHSDDVRRSSNRHSAAGIQ
jgi:hypothetical protein